MSNHLSKEEFMEHVQEGEFDLLWAAYKYACDGEEPSMIERMTQMWNRAIERTKLAEKKFDVADDLVCQLEDIIVKMESKLFNLDVLNEEERDLVHSLLDNRALKEEEEADDQG